MLLTPLQKKLLLRQSLRQKPRGKAEVAGAASPGVTKGDRKVDSEKVEEKKKKKDNVVFTTDFTPVA